MESLPDVATEMIAKRLSGEELAAWCATSHFWREWLNNDHYWRKRVNQETAEYLEQTQCKVEPVFQSPEVEGSGLSAVGKWRMSYMRQVHLWNNWRHNRHASVLVPSDSSYPSYAPQFYKNDYLVLCQMKGSVVCIQLWDVKHSPCLVCSTSESALVVISIQLSGSKIILVHTQSVVIFEISVETKTISFVRRFSSNVVNVIPRYVCQGNFLVGLEIDLLNSGDSNILHVWDVGKETTVMQKPAFHCHLNPWFDSNENWFSMVKRVNNLKESVSIYSLPDCVQVFATQPVYSGSGLYKKETFVIKDYVFICLQGQVDIYSFSSSQLIKVVQTNVNPGNIWVIEVIRAKLQFTNTLNPLFNSREEKSLTSLKLPFSFRPGVSTKIFKRDGIKRLEQWFTGSRKLEIWTFW